MQHGSDPEYTELVNQRRLYAQAEGQPGSGSGSLGRRMLFPELASRPVGLIGEGSDAERAKRTREALTRISNRMLLPYDNEHGDIPAAFTYFGQFVFHDLVFSRFFAQAGPGAPRIGNADAGSLDLSGLYGRGPIVDPHLYDTPSDADPTNCRFPMGVPAVADEAVMSPVDPTVVKGRDLPRLNGGDEYLSLCGRKTPYRPLIADPRNDDNLILGQLTATLMQIHNRLVDIQIRDLGASADHAFVVARGMLTSYYRTAVVKDYMKRILAPPIWAYFFHSVGPEGRRPPSGLPLEFSFGASRFAHAMVRDRYKVNQTIDSDRAPIEEVMRFSSQRPQGKLPVRENWIVDWKQFAELGDAVPQRARRISPMLNFELSNAPHARDLDGTPRSIAFMDMWRCYELGLPSGQDVAAAVAALPDIGPDLCPVLKGTMILPSAGCKRRSPFLADQLENVLSAYPEFLAATPLSYYVIQEASILGDDGNHLGPVGSYIIAAAIAAGLAAPIDAGIEPGLVRLPAKSGSLADLLSLADVELTPNAALRDLLNPIDGNEFAARGFRRTGNLSS